MPFAAIGSAIWGFLKRIPDWVIWLLAAIIFLKFVDMRAEKRGRDKAKEAFDKEAAEAEAQVISNIQETTDAVIHEADTVREHTSASVLPDGSAALEKYHYRD